MAESFPDGYTPEVIAIGAGVLAFIPLAIFEREAIFHMTEGEHTVNTVNNLKADIKTDEQAMTAFSDQPHALQQQVEQVLSKKIAADKAEIHTTEAHHPIYAGGQQAEAIPLALTELAVIPILFAIATHGVRRAIHNYRNRKSSQTEDAQQEEQLVAS